MAETTEFDVAIIGGWGGAHAAAYLAAEGLKVALVEDRLIGGECHYWACNPTKALLRPIEVLGLAKAVPGVRETVKGDQPDIAAGFAKGNTIIDHLSDGAPVAGLKAAGVEVFHAHGRLSGERRVTVAHADGHEGSVRATHSVVLASRTRA